MILSGESSIWVEKNIYLLLLDGMFSICLLSTFGLSFYSRLLFPYWFSVWMIYLLLKVGIRAFKACSNFAAVYFSLQFYSICFVYLDVLLLCACRFTIAISSHWTDSFMMIKIFFFVTVFDFKSILPNISIATIAFFVWNILLYSFVCNPKISTKKLLELINLSTLQNVKWTYKNLFILIH
jgi:hypothetical protein